MTEWEVIQRVLKQIEQGNLNVAGRNAIAYVTRDGQVCVSLRICSIGDKTWRQLQQQTSYRSMTRDTGDSA